ncbi:MAG: hypothetical protein MUO60_01095 [Clostridiaceae bacterium]|nr:hypothetical protein [Clostridiaceae bacterium]
MKMVKMFSISLALMLITFATVAFASSFTSTFSFNTTLEGASRDYDGSDMNFSATSVSVGGIQHNVATTYEVSLYRTRLFKDDFIGTTLLPRDSAGSASWDNVGSGTYYFTFWKAFDGVTIESNNVDMYN